jgi:hypothetical protein
MTDFPATDWSRYDVPTIAAMLLGDDDGESWRTVNAWLAAYETISVHQSQLTRAQTELSEAWPPDHSAAATAFLDMVGGLSASLAETADAAYGNARAVSNSLDALATARDTVASLHQQWHAQAATSSPEGAAWAKDLNTKAQQIMRITDQAIFDNTQRLVVPPVMSPLGAFVSDRITPVPVGQSGQRAPTTRRQNVQRSPTSMSDTLRSPVKATSAADASRLKSDGLTSDVSAATGAAAAVTGVTSLGGVIRPRVSATAVGNGATSSETEGILRTPARSTISSRTGRPPGPSGNSDTHATSDAIDSSATERGGLLAPQSGLPLQAKPPNHGRRRRRSIDLPEAQKTVQPLIVPKPVVPVVHDPGPGVIGLDR